MRRNSRSSGKPWETMVAVAVSVMAAGLFLACSDGASPPLEELGMREALEAAPAVVARLPPSAALEIRGRLRAARDTQARDLVITSASAPELAFPDVRRIDRARADLGEDAFVGYEVVDAEGALRATALLSPVADRDDGAPIALVGERDPATLTIEDAAIAGSARLELSALAKRGVRRFVRVQGWPAALVVRGDTAYVNASWLVLEGRELESAPVAAPAVTTATAGTTTPANVDVDSGRSGAGPFVSTPSTEEPLPNAETSWTSRATASRDGVCNDCFDSGCVKTKICKSNGLIPCCGSHVSPSAVPADETSLLFLLAPVAYLAVRARRRRTPS